MSEARNGASLPMSAQEKDIAAQALGQAGALSPQCGLRFDRVVERLLSQLRAFADLHAPSGETLLVCVTAPLRQPARIIEELKTRIIALLGSEGADEARFVCTHGNGVRLRRIRHGDPTAAKLIGFVHNSSAAPEDLLDQAEGRLRAGAAGTAVQGADG